MSIGHLTPRAHRTPNKTSELLVGCGIAYAVSYVIFNDVIAVAMDDGYNRVDQAVSELSAKGASPRGFLMAMLPIWTALMIGFGIGLWKAARGRRALQATGAVLIAHGVVAVTWLWFPMSSRADMVRTGGGGNDTGHLVLTALTILFIIAELSLSAVALGRRFRLYALITGVTIVLFGALVGPLAAKLPDGASTPWMGLYERISIGGWLLWMAALATILLREGQTPGRDTEPDTRDTSDQGPVSHLTSVIGQ